MLVALISVATGVASFVVPSVITPRVAHAAASTQTTFSVFGGGDGPGTAIVGGPGGKLWLAEGRTSVVSLSTSGVATQCVTSAFDGISWGYGYENGIAVGGDGNLWVTIKSTYVGNSSSSLVNGVVARVTPSCSVTYFPTPTSSSFPYEIVNGPGGYLWFTEQDADKIAAISTSGAMREYSVPTVSSSPTGIIRGPDGNLWFTESASDKIGRVTPAGNFAEYTVSADSHPQDIVAGPDGNLWFTELGSNAIGRISTSGTGYVEYSTPTADSAPVHITSGPDGAVWFGEDNASQLGRITTAGSITEYAVNANPFGVTAGPDGNMWYTDNGQYHAPVTGGEAVGRLPLAPCATLASSVASAANGSGIRDTPGSQESAGITVGNCGLPTLTNATTSTTVTPPSSCSGAPSIPSFMSTLSYGASTTKTFSFTDPACLGTYTLTSATMVGSSTLATSTTYFVVSNGGGSHVVSDFNGDGYPDLVMQQGPAWAPYIVVYFGGPSGLETRAPQVFTESSPGMPSQVSGCPAGAPNSTDGFGWALAAGRFAGGGYSDLAIGIPGCGTASYAPGAVVVLKGGPAGLTTKGSYFISAPGGLSNNSEFGRQLVSGDFNHDSYDDLAVAAPLDNGVVALEGAVTIMNGSPTGLAGQTTFTESSPGMPGPAPTANDILGWNMAVGDFNHDGSTDLAMVEGQKCAVAVLYGSASGITASRGQYLQAVGCSVYADTVTAGDFNGNGYDDLAIGEEYGGTAGLVEIHYGSKSGLGTVAYRTAQEIAPSTKGMPREPSSIGYFGAAMASGDIKHNGRSDLIVGGASAGCITLWGASTKLTTTGSQVLSGTCLDGLNPAVLTLGDYNDDGYLDVVDCQTDCSVYDGSSTGFAPSASYSW